MKTFLTFFFLLLLGVGCFSSPDFSIDTCYVLNNDPEQTQVRISRETTPINDTPYYPATIIITNSDVLDALSTPGRFLDDASGQKFIYANGDYFEITGDIIIGHQPNFHQGFAATIDGMTATQIPCK